MIKKLEMQRQILSFSTLSSATNSIFSTDYQTNTHPVYQQLSKRFREAEELVRTGVNE